MGQNNSTGFNSTPVTPRGKNSNPPPRPNEPPKIPVLPKIPNYVVAENKVIPNGVADMSNARKLLRPVSQELTKFHPDYADIFQYDPDIDFQPGDDSSLERSLNASGLDKENSNISMNTSGNSSQLTNSFNRSGHLQRTSSLPNGLVNNVEVGNGHVPHASASMTETQNVSQNEINASGASTNLRRTQSMDKQRSQPVKMARHKRQTSLSSAIAIQENVIMEDPREHLYNIQRHEPFSNAMPSTTSLPVKSSFEMDYSMNVTYAQLAEFRRQKRVEELEERTGKKLEALGAELNANNTVPKSPFDRKNLGAKSGTHSVSTGSSETGVSKSKKKKAPAPPPPGPPPRDQSPSKFSLNTEPPADYDMEDIVSSNRQSRPVQRNASSASKRFKAPSPQPLPKSLAATNVRGSSDSSVLTQSNVPPPPPLPSTFSKTNTLEGKGITASKGETKFPLPEQTSLQRSMSQAKAQLEALRKLENVLNNVNSTSDESKKAQLDDNTDGTKTAGDETSNGNEIRNENSDATTLDAKIESKAEGAEKADNKDYNKNSFESGERNSNLDSDKSSEFHEITVSDLHSATIPKSNNLNNTDEGKSPKKMSSLLQHDIVLAAQARGAKIVKTKPPPTLEKPKDLSEMFREELRKAAAAREERQREATHNDSAESKGSSTGSNVPSTPQEDKTQLIFQSNFLKVSRKPTKKVFEEEHRVSHGSQNYPVESLPEMEQDEGKTKEELDQEYKAIAASIDFSKRPSLQSEDMSISSSNTSQRVFSPDWTPEHDLDSDDDIKNDAYSLSERRVSSEGFKASIIPPKINDLTSERKSKKKKQQPGGKGESRKPLESSEYPPVDEKMKFGSIRKFKKSVHESMRNAFGSISKASGKLLKKQKSRDFSSGTETASQNRSPHSDVEDEADLSINANWTFSSDGSGSLRRARSDGFMDHSYQNGTKDSETSEDSADDVGDIDFGAGINDLSNDTRNSNSDSKEKQEMKAMKRAGVAYVSGKGQIIVLPEYETVKVDESGRPVGNKKDEGHHAPKLFKKKSKKYSYESTLKTQEKYRLEEAVSREIREKEKQIEIERQRQQEMERDFLRLRDLETQERLQRQQTVNMQEQIKLLQQEQVRQAHSELNNNTVSLSSLNNIGSVPNVGSMSTPFVGNGQISTPQFMTNSNVGLGSNGYLNHSTHNGSLPPLVAQQRYSVPSFSTTVFSQPLPHSTLATTPDPVNYTSHTAPMVGGSVLNRNLGSTGLPNLTSQELSYLSDYMRMMGVSPPSTQQQWAMLLSTISYNSSGFPGFDPHQNTIPNGFGKVDNGPDLSQIFGSGKTFESTTGGSKGQIISLISGQHSYQPRDINSLQRMAGENVFYKSMPALDTGEVYPQQQQQQHHNSQPHSDTSSNVDHKSGASTTTTILTPTQEPPTVIKSSGDSGVVSVKVPDFQTAVTGENKNYDQNGSQAATGQMVSGEEIVTSPKSPTLSPKVYGPIGFRPVSFHARST